jgi:hypothetical protein
MCSLRFENNLLTIEGVRFEENTIIEAFVRFRFASVAITNTDLVDFYRKNDTNRYAGYIFNLCLINYN